MGLFSNIVFFLWSYIMAYQPRSQGFYEARHTYFYDFYKPYTASYPDVSLSMKMCAQRKAGRRQRARRRFACRLYPSHGPLRFITSHSRFALASTMRKTKRLRRRLSPTYFFSSFRWHITTVLSQRQKRQRTQLKKKYYSLYGIARLSLQVNVLNGEKNGSIKRCPF